MVILEILSPLLIAALGFILARVLHEIDDHSVGAICLYLFTPAFILRQAMGQDITSNKFVWIFFFTLFHLGLLFVLAAWIYRYFDVPPRTRRLFLLMTMSVSILTLQKLQPFLGNPLESVQTVKALVFFHLAFLCTVGLYLGGGRTRSVDNAYQILKNPMVYFFGIGFVLAGLGTTLPNEILEFIDSLYKVMIPLSLVVMGLMLGRYVYFFQMQEYGLLFGPLLVCIVFQLFLSPLLAWIITHMMGFEDIELQRALILSSGAPSGILAALIACVYGRSNERRFAILCVFLTTILSMATLPFWFYLLNRWLPFPTPMA